MRRLRLGYLVAAVVAVLSVAVWVVASEPVSDMVRWTGADPPEFHTELKPVRFGPTDSSGTQPSVLPLTADRTWAVYYENRGAASDNGVPDEDYSFFFGRPQCRGLALDGGTIDVEFIGWDYNYYFSRDGRTWQTVYEVEVSQDGRYRLECGWSIEREISPREPRIVVGADPATARAVGKARRTFWGHLDPLPALGLMCAAALAVATRLAIVRRWWARLRPPDPGAVGTRLSPGAGWPRRPGW